MKAICDALQSFLKSRDLSRQAHLVRLWENWDMVMGPDIAPLAYPMGHRKTILQVGAEDNMAQQDLMFMTPEILERANGFMDEPYFERVEVHLVMGRKPLDQLRPVLRNPYRPPLPPRPAHLGTLHDMDPESPVARCYAKYVRLFDAAATVLPKDDNISA